jgi:hypothetical protein
MRQHAVRIARDHWLAPERVDAPIYGGRYRSLFPDLPALEADEAALHASDAPAARAIWASTSPMKPTLTSRRCGRSSGSTWPTHHR